MELGLDGQSGETQKLKYSCAYEDNMTFDFMPRRLDGGHVGWSCGDPFAEHRDALTARRELDLWRMRLTDCMREALEALGRPGMDRLKKATAVCRLRHDLQEFEIVRNSAHGWCNIWTGDRILIHRAERILEYGEADIVE